MLKKKPQGRKFIIRKIYDKCPFCVNGTEPDYKDVPTLEKFLSERARILPLQITGVCSQHQRRLSTAIKRARILALLPFAEKI